jgi:SHS2 domain-containing protein
MESGFQLFDHTADLGVRVFAPSIERLLRPAGEGLYSVIGELVPEGDPRPERFDLVGGDLPCLLRDYLAQLLLLFDCERGIVVAIDVEAFEPGRLRAFGQSCRLDRTKSSLDREVKAVTYCGLEIRPIAGGYEAKYIVDI